MWKHIPQIQSIPWPRITQFMQEGACMKRNFNWLYCPQQSIAKWRVIPKDQISQIRNSHAHYGLYSDCLYTKLYKCLYTKLKTQYYLHKFEEHITQFWFLVRFKFHKMNNLQFSKRVKPLYLFFISIAYNFWNYDSFAPNSTHKRCTQHARHYASLAKANTSFETILTYKNGVFA